MRSENDLHGSGGAALQDILAIKSFLPTNTSNCTGQENTTSSILLARISCSVGRRIHTVFQRWKTAWRSDWHVLQGRDIWRCTDVPWWGVMVVVVRRAWPSIVVGQADACVWKLVIGAYRSLALTCNIAGILTAHLVAVVVRLVNIMIVWEPRPVSRN